MVVGENAMLNIQFTPVSRFALAILAAGFIFVSHYLAEGGLLLQLLAICVGVGLVTGLLACVTSAGMSEHGGTSRSTRRGDLITRHPLSASFIPDAPQYP